MKHIITPHVHVHVIVLTCVCVCVHLAIPAERTDRLEFWHGGQVKEYLQSVH